MLVKYILLSTCIMKSFFSCPSGPCIPNPCHNGGTCEISEAYRGDTFIGYVCKCPRGFNGIHCQHSKLFIFNVLLFLLIYCVQVITLLVCSQVIDVQSSTKPRHFGSCCLSTVHVISYDEGCFNPHTLCDEQFAYQPLSLLFNSTYNMLSFML